MPYVLVGSALPLSKVWRSACYLCLHVPAELSCTLQQVTARRHYMGISRNYRYLFFGVPILRVIVFWGLCWGPLILGNHHIISETMKTRKAASQFPLKVCQTDTQLPLATCRPAPCATGQPAWIAQGAQKRFINKGFLKCGTRDPTNT